MQSAGRRETTMRVRTIAAHGDEIHEIDEITELVTAARGGDADAWARLVEIYSGMLRAKIQPFRLSREDAQDVLQTTWLLALENLRDLERENRLGGWLATIATRECIKLVRRSKEICTGDPRTVERPADNVAAAQRDLARAWFDRTLAEVVDGLPAAQRDLFRALTEQPRPHYAAVAGRLGRPIGSIGPSRARCFTKVRTLLEDRGVTADFLD
jgi:RNA polymerase sigma factor (sigma-70 family)